MTEVLHVDDLRDGYIEVVRWVLEKGRSVSPRGQHTVEVRNAVITVPGGRPMLPLGVGRKTSRTVAAVEALQLISGVADAELVVRASQNFKRYREPTGVFHGAYGERIGAQVLSVIRKLDEDPDTRQAVVTLWDPQRDNLVGKLDYPCTVSMIFFLRDGQLELDVTMRSNDVWLGLAYDAFQFTQLQWTVARALGVRPGTYTHHAHSLHLYTRDFPHVNGLHRSTGDVELPTGVGADGMPGWKMMDRATTLLRGYPTHELTESESWYQDAMKLVHE